MLAPITETIADAPMQAFCEASLLQYPDFVHRVREAGTVDPHLRLDGILSAAYTPETFVGLRARAEAIAQSGHACEILDRASALAAEPALGGHVCGALLVPDEGHVDNRRLGRALAAACAARGVVVQTGLREVVVESDARRILGVRTDNGFVPAGAAINAAGAWASRVAGVREDCIPPVRPVKGQMLALAIPRGFVRRTVWVPGAYFVPRADGRLLIGATVEEAGFDVRVTAGGMHDLLHAASQAAPALAGFAVSETWAGLRPGTPDGLPFIGPTALDGYFLATGHFRNGILLAPATARLVADLLDGTASDTPFELTDERASQEARPNVAP